MPYPEDVIDSQADTILHLHDVLADIAGKALKYAEQTEARQAAAWRQIASIAVEGMGYKLEIIDEPIPQQTKN